MEAVIFDLDGVLTSTDEFHYESWKNILGGYGIEVGDDAKEKLLGLTRSRSLEILLGDRNVNPELSREILKRKNERYLELVDKMGPRDLAPGVSILLQEIHLGRIPIGVASASQNVMPVLQNLGIDGFVRAYSDGIKVRKSKPEPDTFLKTAQALNIKPDMCLTIEDSAAGIQAARSAGMVVIGLGPANQVGEAHFVLEDLANVHLRDLQEIYSRCREKELIIHSYANMPQAA